MEVCIHLKFRKIVLTYETTSYPITIPILARHKVYPDLFPAISQ